MSWSINIVGRDKAKLKAVVREQQCKDEKNQPHSGVPVRVADYICSEIDRIRVYQGHAGSQEGSPGRTYAIEIVGNGSFHESGCNEKLDIKLIQMVE